MTDSAQTAADLIRRYHNGEPHVIGDLLEAHRGWVHRFVRRSMYSDHRLVETSADVVQDVCRKVVEQGPAFMPSSDEEFRRVLGTLVVNHMRDRWRWSRAARRDRARERSLESETISGSGVRADSTENPARQAQQAEEEARFELALHLIDPDDAELLRRHHWEGQGYDTLARDFELTYDAVRMRIQRAVTKLGRLVKDLEMGQFSRP